MSIQTTSLSATATQATPPVVDPVLQAYDNALSAFYAQLQKTEGENPPNPIDLAKLAQDIKNLNTTEAALDPKNPDEAAAQALFEAATGPASETGGLFQTLTADANNPSALEDDIENCQAGNADSIYYSNLISNLSAILPTA